MTRIQNSITVDASREETWRALADLSAIQDYFPEGVKRAVYTSEHREGLGASRHCDLHPFGSVEERATRWNDGKALSLEITDGKLTPPFAFAAFHFDVEEAANGTRVTFTMDYKSSSLASSELLWISSCAEYSRDRTRNFLWGCETSSRPIAKRRAWPKSSAKTKNNLKGERHDYK